VNSAGLESGLLSVREAARNINIYSSAVLSAWNPDLENLYLRIPAEYLIPEYHNMR